MPEVFQDKEAEYLDWVAMNPSAYVANVDKAHSNPQYPMIHHAFCGSLAGKENYTTNVYYKVCSPSYEDIEAWALQTLGRTLNQCSLCLPTRWTGYWWVNHKQTSRVELEGGYIWSPMTKQGGVRNQAYINLKLVRPGDVVVSYAGGMIKAIGVATDHYSESAKPDNYGAAGEVWNQTGWRVPVDWILLETGIRPKDHIDQIAPLLPDTYSPLQQNGNGNQGFYLSSIATALGEFVLDLIGNQAQTVRERAASVQCGPTGRLPISHLRKVTALHVWQAVRDLTQGKAAPDFGAPIKFELVAEGDVRLPPKAVFGVAATYALGFAVKPTHFTAGLGTPCFEILSDAGYQIVPKGQATAEPDSDLSFEDKLWAEGKAKLKSHLRRERAPGLSKAKKAKFREVHGKLFCERCNLEPIEKYGAGGDSCIEVHHHAVQVADMAPGHQTSFDDLQCLCANCHRVLHWELRSAAAQIV